MIYHYFILKFNSQKNMIIQNLINYIKATESQAKTLIASCIGTAVSAYFGPLSWGQFALVHLGSQAIVHGAEPLVDRCKQLFARPAPVVPLVVHHPAALLHRDVRADHIRNFNGALSEEAAIRRATQESLRYDDVKLTQEAIQRSHVYESHSSGVRCAIDELAGGESFIDKEFTVQVDGQSFHLFNLVFSLLSQTEMQNPFNRKPLSEESVIEIAGQLGINPEEFMNIWAISSTPGFAPTHHVPETEAAIRTDFRFQLLERMLKSKRGTLDQIRQREKMLGLLNQEQTWVIAMRKRKLLR